MRPLLADGCEVLFWGDILRHHPELVSELPKEGAVACAWHYEAPQREPVLPDELLALLDASSASIAPGSPASPRTWRPSRRSGLPFWVCPGTSSWNSLLGRLPNARGEPARRRGDGPRAAAPAAT